MAEEHTESVSQQNADSVGTASASKSSSMEALTKEVLELKTVLDDPMSDETKLLETLRALKSKGAMPTKILSDTMIGKTVNQIAKASTMEAVKDSALGLVAHWRQVHRKRKENAAAAAGSEQSAKRTASMDSEVTQVASQRSSDGLSHCLSTDSLAGMGMSQEHEGEAVQPSVQEDAGINGSAAAVAAASAETEKKKMTPQREKVRQKILEALGKEESIENKFEDADKDDQDRMMDPVVLATKIEESLAEQLGEKEYFNQARALIYNLKDKKNHNFRLKLLLGFYPCDQIPKLKAEDMASDEKNAERAKLRKYAMEEIQSDWAMKHGQIRTTGMFTCGKCKQSKTTYFQMQTRSSDEPMTTFVTCLNCNNRWKFC